MLKKIILFVFVLVLLSGFSYAVELKEYNIDFNIVGNKVVVENNLKFDDLGVVEFQLPSDHDALSVYVDDELVFFDADDVLSVDLENSSRLRFSYVTHEFIDKTNFLMNLGLDFNVEDMIIKLVLPEGAVLKKPISDKDLASGSIYPKPSKALTDGRSLIFYWKYDDMDAGDEVSIFAQIEPEKSSILWIVVILCVFIFAIIYIFRPKTETKIIVEKEDMVEKHLKEDEEQIINVLKQKEGSCEQGTLRVVTGFSKATLSRLLMELEERNVIYKEKRGKKNLIFLKK